MDYTRDGVLIKELAAEKDARNLSREEYIKEIVDVLTNGNVSMGNFSGDGEGYANDTDWVPYSERPETYIVPVLFAIIFIIGVLGNGTLIRIFIEHRQMRNVPNMYICSLAVGDLLVILFCVPFTSTVYTVESWPYGLLVCKFSEFIKDVSIGVSVFTLTALSADRYFAIIDPMRKLPGRRATRITCATIAGIWLVSLLIALPSVIYSYIRVFEHESRTYLICYPFPPELGPTYPKIVVLLKFLGYYFVPLGFIATFYIIMARHLVLSTRNMPGEAQGQQASKQTQGRKKVAKMVLSFVVIFAMCFFPSHMFFLWFYFYPDAESHFNDFWNIVRIVGFCLSFFNSCINPITLYCVSGTFRKYFNKHLFCCMCHEERDNLDATYGHGVSMSISTNVYNDRVNNQRNGGNNKTSCRWNSTASSQQLLPMTRLNNTHNAHHNNYNSHHNNANNSANASLLSGNNKKASSSNRRAPPNRGPTSRVTSQTTLEQEFTITSFIDNADSIRSLENLK